MWEIEDISDISDHEPQYHLSEIHYRDVYGNLLFKEPMKFKRLWGVGNDLVHDYRRYEVVRVAIADDIQHVNLKEMQDKSRPKSET